MMERQKERKVALIYSDRFLDHKTGMHCENPARLTKALTAINKFSLISGGKCEIVAPRPATIDEVKLIHDPQHIEDIRRLSERGGGHYDGDTVLSKESYEVALLAAGGAIKGCELMFSGKTSRVFCLVRPPAHHAGISGSALGAASLGFCLFNNIAIAAAYALKKNLVKRILILDIDVHHGNATQEAFNSSPDVLYVSTHQRGIYPGTGYENEIGMGEGTGFKLNLPLPSLSDDKIYMNAFNEIILPVAEQFRPELVLLSVGFDAHHSDFISGMSVTAEGYGEMVRSAIQLAERYSGGKVMACLEGGYSDTCLSTALPEATAALAGTTLEIEEKTTAAPESTVKKAEDVFKKDKDAMKEHWKL
jgi:acetoin utilization deacetylase AcuC-like enzyme